MFGKYFDQLNHEHGFFRVFKLTLQIFKSNLSSGWLAGGQAAWMDGWAYSTTVVLKLVCMGSLHILELAAALRK